MWECTPEGEMALRKGLGDAQDIAWGEQQLSGVCNEVEQITGPSDFAHVQQPNPAQQHVVARCNLTGALFPKTEPEHAPRIGNLERVPVYHFDGRT